MNQPWTVAAQIFSPAMSGGAMPMVTTPENMVWQVETYDLLMYNGGWVVSGDTLANNVVFHALAVANGASTSHYKGGVHILTGNGGAGTVSGNLKIGGRTFAGSYYWTGRLCEIAFWTAVLTAAEIRALAGGVSPKVIRPLALKAYWPLWGTVLPEVDLGPNKIHAVGQGGSIPAAQHMGGSPMAL